MHMQLPMADATTLLHSEIRDATVAQPLSQSAQQLQSWRGNALDSNETVSSEKCHGSNFEQVSDLFDTGRRSNRLLTLLRRTIGPVEDTAQGDQEVGKEVGILHNMASCQWGS